MPSHIFTRVGQWQNSIASNRASAEAGQNYAAKAFGPGVVWDQIGYSGRGGYCAAIIERPGLTQTATWRQGRRWTTALA
jgi:hypothetical protein